MKGYWIALVNVTDADTYAKYASQTQPALQKYNAKIIVRGGQCQTVEGETYSRVVVIEFPSYEGAVACYNSEEYQTAREIQVGAATRNITIVEGVE